MEASVGMRETVPSLKFKDSKALSKQNLKDREGTTTLPLRESERATNFLVVAYIKKLVYITKGKYHFLNLDNLAYIWGSSLE